MVAWLISTNDALRIVDSSVRECRGFEKFLKLVEDGKRHKFMDSSIMLQYRNNQ